MNKPMLSCICAIAILVGSAAFFEVSQKAALQGDVAAIGESQSNQDKIPPPPPPPPRPPPHTEKLVPPPPEPARTLVGVTDEELSHVKQLLPKGAEIATYPVGNSYEKAALSFVDLDGDGKPEIIVVHLEREATIKGHPPLLRLDVIPNNAAISGKRFSVQLLGMYVYTNIYDQAAAPFAVRDITGDGSQEIIVTSAIGASIGATLQAFSFDGESLKEIARIEANDIDIIDKGAGKPAVIRSRWNARWRDEKTKDEEKVETFVWNGKEFQQAK